LIQVFSSRLSKRVAVGRLRLIETEFGWCVKKGLILLVVLFSFFITFLGNGFDRVWVRSRFSIVCYVWEVWTFWMFLIDARRADSFAMDQSAKGWAPAANGIQRQLSCGIINMMLTPS
jgi:hypothetical protein